MTWFARLKNAPSAIMTALLLAWNSSLALAFMQHQRRPIQNRWTASTSGLFALTAELEHAREVFAKFDENGSGFICSVELGHMLEMLDIEASVEDADALFKYLDGNGDGEIDFDDFLPWYSSAAEAAKEVSSTFQSLLIGRRTVNQFDQTPVSDDVLRRAVACAINAPNRSMSEPWRFIKIGPQTVAKFAQLNEKRHMSMETNDAPPILDWTTIPGWCVVTTKLTPDNPAVELDDFKSTSCAVQNFMLSMWSEGIGTKWTSGPVQFTQEFADLCGVDTTKERVAGCIWYGFATGGLVNADPKRRKKGVDDVLSTLE
jgi:nitroreductase